MPLLDGRIAPLPPQLWLSPIFKRAFLPPRDVDDRSLRPAVPSKPAALASAWVQILGGRRIAPSTAKPIHPCPVCSSLRGSIRAKAGIYVGQFSPLLASCYPHLFFYCQLYHNEFSHEHATDQPTCHKSACVKTSFGALLLQGQFAFGRTTLFVYPKADTV